MKINLVLSGGAARGAFHLGVLKAIDELGFEVVAISGSSIGAIIGASYASGVKPQEQLKIFRSKAFKKAFEFNYFQKSVFSINTKKKILQELIPVQNLEQMAIKMFITTMDLKTGEIVRFDKGDTKTLCVASSALVPMFHPVSYENYELVDGGVLDNLPIEPLLNSKYPLVGIDLHPLEYEYKNSFLGILKRTLFLMWRANTQKNLLHVDLYISDKKLSSFSLFSFKKLQKLFDLGYERGMILLSEYKKQEE